MTVSYFKRFRMEIDLVARLRGDGLEPDGYRLIPWRDDHVDQHAEVKYLSFRDEIDSLVFPCFGNQEGCLRLMNEISRKEGFLPSATWLAEYVGDGHQHREYCGTIQGICDEKGFGAIQNVGITPWHRGRGVGSWLVRKALEAFVNCGLRQAYLEVTADNRGAVELYQRMGFRRVKTLYKAVEVAYS